MSTHCEARKEALASALERVRSRIAAAARRVGRDPNDVTLVAVSKTRPSSDVVAALACDHTVFGENYAQELRDKSRELAGSVKRSRPWFRLLGQLAQAHGLQQLSMGTTGDYEIAIEEGATLVRVGAAIFGAREYKARSDDAHGKREVAG